MKRASQRCVCMCDLRGREMDAISEMWPERGVKEKKKSGGERSGEKHRGERVGAEGQRRLAAEAAETRLGGVTRVTLGATNGLSGLAGDAPRLRAKNALSSTSANEWPCFDFDQDTPSLPPGSRRRADPDLGGNKGALCVCKFPSLPHPSPPPSSALPPIARTAV